MKRKTGFILILLYLLFLQYSFSQERYDTGAGSTTFYTGFKLGSPLFWGDVRSSGEKFRLGYGVGLFAGYRFTSWLYAELDVDYLAGKLGAADWQLSDKIDGQGTLQYIDGSYRLGDIYSEVRSQRLGLRVPILPLYILGSRGRFQVELAPHAYFNTFQVGIHDADSKDKVMDGAKPRSLSYSFGGDIGFSYQTGKRSSLFLRSSLSWLNDDRFEGITSQPAWRENYMLYTTIGFRLDLGKSRQVVRSSQSSSSLPVPAVKEAPGRKVADKQEVASVPQKEQPREEEVVQVVSPVKVMPYEWIAPLYFKPNQSSVSLTRYTAVLQHIVALAKEYPDLSILIEGWTDTQGTAVYNEQLAQKRAQSVADYLLKNGIASNRLHIASQGEDLVYGENFQARRVQVRFLLENK